jgi:hypothetical protein
MRRFLDIDALAELGAKPFQFRVGGLTSGHVMPLLRCVPAIRPDIR